MKDLTKVYCEPTNHCNMSCATCIRHVWDAPMGFMSLTTFLEILEGLESFPEAHTIAFMGFGEPLLNRNLPEMIKLSKNRGFRTEVTTNGLLIDRNTATSLLNAGLDQIVVSIDGISRESQEAIRKGAATDDIIAKMKLFSEIVEFDFWGPPPIRIGIEFVAMRQNISELPRLETVARSINASFILVSHVLPYSEALQKEILYEGRQTARDENGSPSVLLWKLPNMDWTNSTAKPLSKLYRKNHDMAILDMHFNDQNNLCPFISQGALAISWDGRVCPCPPLMYSYPCFIRDRRKEFKHYTVGKLTDSTLREIWDTDEYKAFRKRVDEFSFPPCSDCGGCDMALNNETDCMGNPFPVCGDCLWARGLIRCS